MPTEGEQTDAIRAVLFDFGGVLAEEGFREGLKEIARRRGLDPEAFYRLGAKAVDDSGYVTGEGSEDDFWELMCRNSGLKALLFRDEEPFFSELTAALPFPLRIPDPTASQE